MKPQYLSPTPADVGEGPIDFEIVTHPSTRDPKGISARSPEDVVPVEDCKRALGGGAPTFDEALYRRCGGDGEGEEESGTDSSDEESDDDSASGDDNDDGDLDNSQIASNSPRQDCILTQMELFPMPNLGLCMSIPDPPPTSNPAPPVTPVPAPVTPQPVPELAPKHAPAPVDADGPARATPKRAIGSQSLEGLLAQSPYLDDEDPACETLKRPSDSASSADVQHRCGGGVHGVGGGDSGDEGEGGGEGGAGGEGDIGDTGSEDSSKS